MRQRVTAVVPTYRPDAAYLEPLLMRLSEWGVPIVVSDDGSPSTSDGSLRRCVALGLTVIRHRSNHGIARGLNDGLGWALAVGSSWLLTLDQDSMIDEDYLARILQTVEEAEAALGGDAVGAVAAGRIADASGNLGYPLTDVCGVPTTEEVIQTGTIWNTTALASLGGFDEALGIDAVDAAACLALRRSGRHVVVAPDLSVAHRIGSGRQVRLLGRDVLASGHRPERRTTIVRNRLRLFPSEFAQSPRHAIRTLRRVAVQTGLAVTIEDDRWAKAKASARGLLPPQDR